MQLINETPFAACTTIEMNSEGCEILALTVKATFRIMPGGDIIMASSQREIEYSDVFHGEPNESSIRYESDVTIGKTTTDIVLVGHAFPQKTGDRETFVMLSLGNCSKIVKVFGDRYWDSILGVFKKSTPDPFEKIPLVYERAFGGVDTSHPNIKYHEFEERNPVGTGFRAKRSSIPIKGLKLPNIENPKELISSPYDRPSPAGFGFIAKNWSGRRKFAGTYDNEWRQSGMPFLPQDFNPRFFSGASEGLITEEFLKGGEVIKILNVSVHGPISISIPKIYLNNAYLMDAKPIDIKMNLDTVIIDTDQEELILTWHGMANIHGQVDRVKWVHADILKGWE